jgi:hypothetical protein
MKILVACEESQAVTIELRRLGHEAYSCDIIPCSGGHPEWHIQQDVLPLLSGKCTFRTCDGTIHTISGNWDMIIAFPPCTHLAVSGAAWFEKKRASGEQREGIEFFMNFVNADCPKIAIENPVGIISGDYISKWFPDLQEKHGFPIKPTQKIQPWQFGNEAQKTTCLWLKGLSPLTPTEIVGKGEMKANNRKDGSVEYRAKWFEDARKLSPEERAKARSKTFPGIARAMAEQWAGECKEVSI